MNSKKIGYESKRDKPYGRGLRRVEVCGRIDTTRKPLTSGSDDTVDRRYGV